MEPPSLSTELRNYCYGSPWHALAENSFKNRSIGLVGLIVSLKNDRNGRGFAPKWAWLQNCTIGTLLQEILDPPLAHCLRFGKLRYMYSKLGEFVCMLKSVCVHVCVHVHV